MKINYLSLLALAIALSGCNDPVEPVPGISSPENPDPEQTTLRTPEEAIEAAHRALSLLAPPVNDSRAVRNTRHIDMDCGVVRLKEFKSRSDSELPFYIVNYADNQGYAVIATEKSAQELIAVTTDGHLENLSDVSNPGFRLFMELATQYVNAYRLNGRGIGNTNPIGPPRQFKSTQYYRTDTIWHANIAPRTPNFWNQDSPLGDFCPNETAGCSNVALALALSYFEHPKQLILSYHDSVMGKVITLDWAKLKTHMHFDGYYTQTISQVCAANPDKALIHYQLAHLGRQLGHWNNSTYNFSDRNTTTTKTSELRNNLEGLGMHGVTRDYNVGDAKKALKYSPVLLMEGQKVDGGMGHMWICDGARAYHLRQSLWEIDQFGNETQISDWTEIDGASYNFFNWGWGPDKKGYHHNGWYLDGVFTYKVNDWGQPTQNTYFDIKYTTVTF